MVLCTGGLSVLNPEMWLSVETWGVVRYGWGIQMKFSMLYKYNTYFTVTLKADTPISRYKYLEMMMMMMIA
jgi:hypothetical protein